ncbi:C-GCAxxG-C-C family protein [Desulfosporosinus sp. BICA1-9]|uniref:C-GCAxxG-C-C family protein n=1 Tax=Desulfosporosinus sp. BICA1-9 TaxID=1531958 RepID=UPI00054BCCDD|nr:C-GCAxxG-C-C family protein [Desulfosporosinus sp. BICA1-9]KJS48471.1 MAG: redox-active protein [Peptococcaceae bacterium BRH_c23]KJS89446.1 MAG: redox-active protein [Desulfosporosinus sp. BICA1-9]
MQYREYINERVHSLYWKEDLNCAITSLLIFSEIFKIDLDLQILDAAIGMPGAGRYGAQCGLVTGSLMFIGIKGKENGLEHEAIVDKCHNFAKDFEKEFGSLNCRDLRPEGFKPDNPPHLCEEITKRAIMFTLNILAAKI